MRLSEARSPIWRTRISIARWLQVLDVSDPLMLPNEPIFANNRWRQPTGMISWCSGVAACLGFALVSCSEKSADHDPPEGDPRPAASSAPAAFKVQSTQELLQFEERETELDPHNDGWASEAFHVETQDQLTILAAAMEAGELPNGILVSETESAAGALRPRSLSAIFESNGLRVLRPPKSALESAKPGGTLREELQHLVASLHEGETEVSVRFKQFQVSPPGDGAREASSTVLYTAKSASSIAKRVQNATWEIAWIRSAEDRFLMSGIRLKEFEEIEFEPPTEAEGDRALFRDRTEDLIGAMPRAGGLIRYGANEMGERVLFESGRSFIGIALGDANGDGIDDVYAPQARDLPNLFFLSQPDGSHREVAAENGLDWLESTAGAFFADFDNDGDQDLVIATQSLLVIHANEDGTGLNFTRIAEFPQADTASLAAADYDGDGLLDLYVCNYQAASEQETLAMPDAIYNARLGGRNRLYRNIGDLTFSDVTKETGMDVDATRLSLAAS